MTRARIRPAPEVCPCCGEPYEFRPKTHQDDELSVGSLDRHSWCGWVFFHEIPRWACPDFPTRAQLEAAGEEGMLA